MRRMILMAAALMAAAATALVVRPVRPAAAGAFNYPVVGTAGFPAHGMEFVGHSQLAGGHMHIAGNLVHIAGLVDSELLHSGPKPARWRFSFDAFLPEVHALESDGLVTFQPRGHLRIVDEDTGEFIAGLQYRGFQTNLLNLGTDGGRAIGTCFESAQLEQYFAHPFHRVGHGLVELGGYGLAFRLQACGRYTAPQNVPVSLDSETSLSGWIQSGPH